MLALRTGAAVFFADPRRIPGHRARYRLTLKRLHAGGDDTADRTRRLTRAFLESLEATIREAPEQYFWFHDRWKTRPKGESSMGNRPVEVR